MIAVIVPTIRGREESLERTWRSYAKVNDEHPVFVHVYPDSPSSGEGWLRGTEQFVEKFGKPDYLHLSNDDCELTGSLLPAVEACDVGKLPAPIVRNPGGSLQSAGGDMARADNLIKEVGTDWEPVGFTTIPFLSWEQWQQVGMQPVHYSSDVWVSHRGRQLGIETVLRHGYSFTHWNHSVGRGAGMSQGARAGQDKAIVEQALSQAQVR